MRLSGRTVLAAVVAGVLLTHDADTTSIPDTEVSSPDHETIPPEPSGETRGVNHRALQEIQPTTEKSRNTSEDTASNMVDTGMEQVERISDEEMAVYMEDERTVRFMNDGIRFVASDDFIEWMEWKKTWPSEAQELLLDIISDNTRNELGKIDVQIDRITEDMRDVESDMEEMGMLDD